MTSKQSGSKSGDLCINHEIYSSFDGKFKVSGDFLDISKTFEKIWHKSYTDNLT